MGSMDIVIEMRACALACFSHWSCLLACLLYALCPEYLSKYEALEKTEEISKVKCTSDFYFKAHIFAL